MQTTTTTQDRVSIIAKIREMDVAEIEDFLDNPEPDERGVRTMSREVIQACARQWKQLTTEPFPYTVIN